MKRRPKKAFRQTPESFWADVDKQSSLDGCWLWTGCIGAYGYGALTYQNKSWRAHRLSYILTYGDLPVTNDYHGTCVLHKCDNRQCVNPEHLFSGTQTDNLRDMRSKNRQASPFIMKGSEQKASKLKEKDIPVIMEMRSRKISLSKIGAKFNVSKVCISYVVNGKSWAHVPREVIKQAQGE